MRWAVTASGILALAGGVPAEPLDRLDVGEGLVLKKWAQQPMLRNAVAIDVAPDGRVFVTETTRRKASDLDIRQFREWIETDLSLTSVDEKRAFYRSELTEANQSKYRGKIKDRDLNGVHDWRDLTVLSDYVHVLEDTDGDGRADKAGVFASGFDTEVTGVAGGVLVHEGHVYATVAPDFWKLTDADGDGVAERRESLATGFSVHVAYAGHNMHGPTLGPDGRIYWSIADKGMNVVSKEGQRFFYPNQGCVMRCEMDGSGFEVFAHGLRNPQELAFDEFGNLFSVDNDGDMPGERERLVYISEGSDAGWRCNWQYRKGGYNPWLAEKLAVPPTGGQPAYLTPALANHRDGPTGFAYNPGTALGEAHRGHFFLTCFPSGKLVTFRLEPEGASFRMEGERELASGFLWTGINFGPDGALWLADWASGGYALDEKGAVWRLDDPVAAQSSEREAVREYLNKDLSDLGEQPLVRLVAHADQRVRLRAQFELVRRDEIRALEFLATNPRNRVLDKVHGVWGIGQVGRAGGEVSGDVLEAVLTNVDAEVRAQGAKVCGEIPQAAARTVPLLAEMLGDPEARPRFFAAIALGRLESKGVTDALVRMAARAGEDAHLRHAAVQGLAGCASAGELAALAAHESVAVRLAAVVALREQVAPEVAVFLRDTEERVATEAALAIHDDGSIPGAMAALSVALGEHRGEAFVRRAINANLRSRDPGSALRVALYAADEANPVAMRVLALRTLENWPEPPVLDAVEGRYRKLAEVGAAEVVAAVGAELVRLASAPEAEVQQAAAAAARALGMGGDESGFLRILADAGEGENERLGALRAILAGEKGRPKAIDLAMASGIERLRAEVMNELAVAAPERFFAVLDGALEGGGSVEKQAAVRALASAGQRGEQRLAELLKGISAGKTDRVIALDALEAAESMASDELGEVVKAFEGNYDVALEGGNIARGEALFMNHLAAQCVRCHQVEPGGSEVGPDLSTVGERLSREQLLQSMTDPGAVIADGYGMASVTMKGGDVVAGTVLENGETVVLKLADGSERRIANSEVGSMTPVVSSMPPMGAILTRGELRDLVAYLVSRVSEPQ